MPRRSSRRVILRWMPTPRLSEARRAVPAAAIVWATMLLVVGFGVGGSDERSLVSQASGWRGLVGGPRSSVTVGQREIVVLKTPSLAQRVAANGGLATQHQEHEWTRAAIAAQKQLLAEMATHGILIRVDFSFARVLNGFSAPLDPSAVALLERQSDVAGVYPVRVAYPASLSSRLLGKEGVAVGAGSLLSVLLPGYDGRGADRARRRRGPLRGGCRLARGPRGLRRARPRHARRGPGRERRSRRARLRQHRQPGRRPGRADRRSGRCAHAGGGRSCHCPHGPAAAARPEAAARGRRRPLEAARARAGRATRLG